MADHPMTPLIDMLENAECGSPELSGLFAVAAGIAEAVNPKNPAFVRVVGDDIYTRVAPYSESLDAALSALPEGWEYSITTVYGFVAVELPLNCGDHVPSVSVIRADCNAALALITAILKATREGTE